MCSGEPSGEGLAFDNYFYMRNIIQRQRKSAVGTSTFGCPETRYFASISRRLASISGILAGISGDGPLTVGGPETRYLQAGAISRSPTT
jgi:hypothetical protein